MGHGQEEGENTAAVGQNCGDIMGGGHKEQEGRALLVKEAFLAETEETLEAEGRRESDAQRHEKKVGEEIESKNVLEEIPPYKTEENNQNVWEEAKREDLGRILVASRDIQPWEQVACHKVELL